MRNGEGREGEERDGRDCKRLLRVKRKRKRWVRKRERERERERESERRGADHPLGISRLDLRANEISLSLFSNDASRSDKCDFQSTFSFDDVAVPNRFILTLPPLKCGGKNENVNEINERERK